MSGDPLAGRKSMWTGFVSKALSTVDAQLDRVFDIPPTSTASSTTSASATSVVAGASSRSAVSLPAPSILDKPVDVDGDSLAPPVLPARSDEPPEVAVDQPQSPVSNVESEASPDVDHSQAQVDDGPLAQRERQLVSAVEENAKLQAAVNAYQATIESLQLQIRNFQSTDTPSHAQAGIQELQQALKAKSEQIQGLLDEGNSLSLANGKLREGLKKLKLKYQESVEAMNALEQKYVQVQNQLVDVKEKLSNEEGVSKNLTNTIKILTGDNEGLTGQIKALEKELEASKDQQNSLQVTLDRAWREVADLRKTTALATTEAESNAAEKEANANFLLKKELEDMKAEFMTSEQSLRREVFQLKSSTTRLEDELQWKEDEHRKEIASFQKKLQAAELRNEDLSQSVQEATRPLLRQIESLQTHSLAIQETFKTLERNLALQLDQVTRDRDELSNASRDMTVKLADMERNFVQVSKELEEQSNLCKQLGSELASEKSLRISTAEKCAELEVRLKSSISENDDNLYLVKMQVKETLNAEFQQQLHQFESVKKSLESQLKDKELASERLRAQLLSARSRTANDSPLPENMALSATPTSAGFSMDNHQNQRILSLTNQLSQLEQQLKNALDAKEQMSEEFIQLTVKYNQLKTDSQEVVKLRQQVATLSDENCDHVLMISELRQDIREMKQVYRSQIQELVEKVEIAASSVHGSHESIAPKTASMLSPKIVETMVTSPRLSKTNIFDDDKKEEEEKPADIETQQMLLY
eukprot:Partr_v1_DN27560_c0_g1_i2_m30185 putative TATA element modulatory factor 1